MAKKPVMLVIMDGWGINKVKEGNAIANANLPNYDRFLKEYPNNQLQASGMDVGLPTGQMGNSEVGHLNIGAGRIVYQELTRITKAIDDGDFFENAELNAAMDACVKNGTSLHTYGLLSDGGVHSHITHLYGLIQMAKKKGLKDVYIHCILDGRDTPPSSGKEYLNQLETKLREIGVGKIASVSGRYYAMDRDNRWERVEKAYSAWVLGEGEKATSSEEAIATSYNKEVTDEFVLPTVITENGNPVATIKKGDSVVCFNFRPDRAREIARTLIDPNFDGFVRKNGYFPINFVCMTQYDAKFTSFAGVSVAFKPQTLTNTLGEYLSAKGLKQLRIAETEKYAHVTFFFNGGVEEPNKGEDRVLIPSPKVATYDLQPEMSAFEVTDAVVDKIENGDYDLIILNYANSDMVGHTGIIPAAIKAVEAVDTCLGRLEEALNKKGGSMVIIADHGNSDQMVDYNTGEPFTAHTTNPVPVIVVGESNVKVKEGKLADVAPTLLDLMGIAKPAEMTGNSLIEK